MMLTASQWFETMALNKDDDLEAARLLFVELGNLRPSQRELETVLAFVNAIRLRQVAAMP